MDLDTLAELLKSQLHITWSDDFTDSRITQALRSSIPALCAKIGLRYNYKDDNVTDDAGQVIDLSAPSNLRFLLIQYAAYIYDQQGHLFDGNYRTEINACRQSYEVAAANAGESEEDASDDEESE